MSRRLLLLVSLFLGATATGCATLAPRAQAQGFRMSAFGEASETVKANRQFKASIEEALRNLEWESVVSLHEDVKILERSLPEGVEVKDGVITASPQSGYEVIGTFSFNPAIGSTIWFADYNSVGTKALCWWQVPFTWATLLMWQYVVPISYPCIAVNLPLEHAHGYIRQAAKSARADVVVLMKVSKNDETFSSAEGFFLRSVAVPAPKPASTTDI